MNIDIRAIQKEAAGTFTSLDPPEVFKNEIHPLNLFIFGSHQARQDLLADHPQVESVLCISDDELYEMFIPRVIPVYNGPTMSLKLAGAFNQEVDLAIPASTAAEKALGDFAIFAPKKEAKGFIYGTQLAKTFFKDEPFTPKHRAIEHPVIMRVPIVIPKVRGYDITTGDIRDSEVSKSLKNYSPLAAKWLKMHLAPSELLLQDFETPSEAEFPDADDFSVYGNRLLSIKPEGAKPTNPSVRNKIMKEIQAVRFENEQKYFALHPERDFRTSNNNLSPQRSEIQLNQVDLCSVSSSLNTEPTSAKYKRNICHHRIFFSSTRHTADNKRRTTTLAPVLSNEFRETYDLSKSNMAQFLRSCLATHVENRAKSSDYLHRSLNFPHLNNITANLFLFNEYHTRPLDEEVSMIGQRISVLTFLPPPKSGLKLRDYETYVSNTKQNEMDYVSCEVAENRKIIDKNLSSKEDKKRLKTPSLPLLTLTPSFPTSVLMTTRLIYPTYQKCSGKSLTRLVQESSKISPKNMNSPCPGCHTPSFASSILSSPRSHGSLLIVPINER